MNLSKLPHALLIAIEGLLCTGLLFLIPADSKNSWALGFSAARLGMLAVLLLASLASLAAYLRGQKKGGEGGNASGLLDTPNRRFEVAIITGMAGLGCAAYFAAWIGLYPSYAAYFLRSAPIMIFGTLVCVHVITALRPHRTEIKGRLAGVREALTGYDRKLKIGAVLLVLGFCLLGIHFYRTANQHAQVVNRYPRTSDQHAYLRIAQKAYETGFQYKGDRKRNPGFPYLLALVYDPSLSEFEFFRRAQQLNILLAMAACAGIFLFTRRLMPTRPALLLTLLAVGSILIYRAGYVQPEPIYYFWAYAAFGLMAWMFVKPSYKLALATGGTAAIAYMVKPSALPAVFLFGLVFGAQAAFEWIFGVSGKNSGGRIQRVPWAKIGQLGVAGAVFLGLLAPFLLENKRMFGQYFYNANTTFFIWYDSIQESQEGTWSHGDDVGWPDMPKEQIPTMQKYLAEHSLAEIVDREVTGLKAVLRPFQKPYSRFNYPIILSVIFGFFFLLDLRKNIGLAGRHPFLLLFTAGYFAIYLLSFAWFSKATDHFVARFTYGLMLPFMFSLMYGTQQMAEGGGRIRLLGRSIRTADLLRVMELVLFGMILYEIAIFAPERLGDLERWYAK